MKSFTLLILLAGSVSSPGFTDCVAPQMTGSIPNGNTASRDDMLAAHKSVKAYEIAVQDYLDCVDKGHESPDRQDRALRTLRDVGDRFNVEFHAFKVKNGA
jgi:hypothetical protein